MAKQIVVYPYNKILLSNKMKQNTQQQYIRLLNTSWVKRRQTQKSTCCMIPFIWNVGNVKLSQWQKVVAWAQQYWEVLVTTEQEESSFWADGNVLYLDYCDGYMVYTCQKLMNCIVKIDAIYVFVYNKADLQFIIKICFTRFKWMTDDDWWMLKRTEV